MENQIATFDLKLLDKIDEIDYEISKIEEQKSFHDERVLVAKTAIEALERDKERIKEQIVGELASCGVVKEEVMHKGRVVDVSLRKKREKIVISDKKAVPDDMMVTKSYNRTTPDNAKIRLYIEKHGAQNWAHIESGYELKLKDK